MITDERTATYIESLDSGNSPYLEKIEREALEAGVPIIRKATQSLIKFLLEANKPVDILEIGAAVGFSSLLMAEYSRDDATITTIENYKKRIKVAKDNIAGSEVGHKVTLLEGDAMEILETLLKDKREFDMIFVDAAKAQYISYYPLVKSMLRSGGILLTDNVLFDGDIVQSRFAVRRRDRTIHARMREFLRTVSSDNDFTTTILPIGDGMTLSVRKDIL